MKILFICKHNSFRSKVAEGVFNKLYKGNKHRAMSRGLIPGPFIYPNTKKAVKSVGYVIDGKPKPLTFNESKEADIIVIVSDNVPASIFENYKKMGKKIIVWKIKDTDAKETEKIKMITKQIEQKVKLLINTL